MNTKIVKPQTSISSGKQALIPALLGGLLILPMSVKAVGFSHLTIDDPHHEQPLNIGVWYPSDAAVPAEPNTPFRQRLALDSTVSGQDHKLVLISHGYGGWMGGHADTALALAEAGFIVAAPSHTGNTYKDMSSTTDKWILERPGQISTAIDYLQQTWQHSELISEGKVGVYGFSAGGLTALSLIGAVPNLSKAEQHCVAAPQEFGCRDETLVPQLLAGDLHALSDEAWGADARIGAAAMAAPGLAFAYDVPALAKVDTPVQLWSALNDDRVPHESNALPLAESIPAAETYWIEDAGHFSFMIQSCTEKLKKYEPDTWQFLCVDKEGFDREAFHTDMNAELVQFFDRNL